MMERNNRGRVLVLDGEWESALAITRSLGKRGIEVHVGSHEPRPLCAFSRYCQVLLKYPDPRRNVPGFQSWVLRQVQTGSYGLILPVTDATICPLMEIRAELERWCVVGMASNDALATAHSKSQTYDLARDLGLPFPGSRKVEDLGEYRQLRRAVTYPVVMKPDRSKIWSSSGECRALTTVYAVTLEELDRHARILLQHGAFSLQEYIDGEVVGLGMLSLKGRPAAFAFQFRSLHEVPLSGGISSYRFTEPVDPELLEYASTLLGNLSWEGIAHVEFIRARASGKPYLTEINGRFWASLPLAVRAGADFPYFLYRSVVGGDREFPEGYQVGLRMHQLAREREWLKEVLLHRSNQMEGLWRYPAYGSIVRDFLRMFRWDEPFDTFDASDPLPGFWDCLRAIEATGGEIAKKMRLRSA